MSPLKPVAGVLFAAVPILGWTPSAPGHPRASAQHASAHACPVAGIKTPCATVWVSSDGTLELNGHPDDLPHVDAAFQKLVKERGTAVYGREAAQGEPHPTAMKVIELIVKYRLPVSMSTKRDFSDTIGPDGRSVPRTSGKP